MCENSVEVWGNDGNFVLKRFFTVGKFRKHLNWFWQRYKKFVFNHLKELEFRCIIFKKYLWGGKQFLRWGRGFQKWIRLISYTHKSRSQLQTWRFLMMVFDNILNDILCKKKFFTLNDDKWVSNSSHTPTKICPKLDPHTL